MASCQLKLLLFIFGYSYLNVLSFASDEDTTSIYNMPIEDLIQQQVTIATKSPQNISETPSLVSVFTAEEIELLGIRDIYDIMKLVPGFEVSQTILGLKPVSIRGVSDIRQGGRVLILLDGMPYNGIMYGSALFYGYEFNMDAIEKVEIIRGPGSALYGRNAFSTVINIKTKTTTKNFIKGKIGGGSFSTKETSISTGFKKKDLSVAIHTKYFNTEGTNRTLYDPINNKNRPWNLLQNNIYFNTNAQYKNFMFNASFTQRHTGSSAGRYWLTNSSNLFQIGTYSLTYTNTLSSKIKLSAKIYGRNELRVQDLEVFEDNIDTSRISKQFNVFKDLATTDYPNGVYAKPKHNAYTYGSQVEFNVKLLKNNHLLTGIQFDNHGVKNATVRSNYVINSLSLEPPPILDDNNQQYTRYNMPIFEPGWIRNNGHNYYNLAWYFQDEHYFSDILSLTVGGRLDFDTEAGLIFNPRLALVYRPFNKLFIKGLYGEAYRAPTTNEQYKIMGLDKGNELLNYEEIATAEFIAGYQGAKIYLQVSAYYNRLKNMIYQQNIDDSTGIKSYFNIGKNKSFGAELESKVFLTNNLFTFFNYAFTDSENEIDNEGIIQTLKQRNYARHNVNIGTNFHFLKHFELAGWMNYHGKVSKFLNYSKPELLYVSQDKVGDYYLLNSTIRMRNIMQMFDVTLYGHNLLNQSYYYQDDVSAHQPPQPGRNFRVVLTVNF